MYTATSSDEPIIGNINPKMGNPGNTVTITGRGFGNTSGTVSFGTVNAQVVSWSDSLIKVVIRLLQALQAIRLADLKY